MIEDSSEDRAAKLLTFLTKSTLSLVPGGGIAAELFTLLVSDPASGRREAFLTDLMLRIGRLEEQGRVRLEDLAGNEEVSALLLQAGLIAQRSAGTEKLRALREAALRGTCNPSERTAAMITVGALDRLTDVHIYVLKGMAQFSSEIPVDRIVGYFEAHYFGKKYPQAIKAEANPELTPMPGRLHPNSETYFMIWHDLISMGLLEERVSTSFGQGGVRAGKALVARTTQFGAMILKNIMAEP